jgi:hypothetical protein
LELHWSSRANGCDHGSGAIWHRSLDRQLWTQFSGEVRGMG